MQSLLIANAICFLILFVIWSNKTWLNIFIKLTLVALFLVNSFYLLTALGYIVKG